MRGGKEPKVQKPSACRSTDTAGSPVGHQGSSSSSSLLVAGASTATADSVELPSAPAEVARGGRSRPAAAPAPPRRRRPRPRRPRPPARCPSGCASARAATPCCDLQRELRRRGQRIAVDGAFGPATKRAVKRIQKRLRMKRTGIVGAQAAEAPRPADPRTAAAAAPAPTPDGTEHDDLPQGLPGPGRLQLLRRLRRAARVGQPPGQRHHGRPRHAAGRRRRRGRSPR